MPNSTRTKVLLLIPHLGGGGAEHVIELLANSLDRAKYDIHLGVLTSSTPGFPGNCTGKKIYELNTSRVRASLLQLFKLVWSIRPGIILSGMAHLNLLVLLLAPALPRKTHLLVRQNGSVSATLESTHHPLLMRLLYAFAYRRAGLVICQSESMKEEIQREFRVDESRLAVLPNPVDSDSIRSAVQRPDAERIRQTPHLVAIGRLVPEKGFDLLLEAFEGVSKQTPELRLIIAGSGPCEASLKTQAERLGIANRVLFSGYVADPATLFRDASLFVLSSRTEGIPNALLEAAAAGLPIVTTPASAGLSDLVAKKEGVWLAHEISAHALSNALQAALAALSPGRRYAHSWVEPFDIARAIPSYEAAIDRVIGDGPH